MNSKEERFNLDNYGRGGYLIQLEYQCSVIFNEKVVKY